MFYHHKQYWFFISIRVIYAISQTIPMYSQRSKICEHLRKFSQSEAGVGLQEPPESLRLGIASFERRVPCRPTANENI